MLNATLVPIDNTIRSLKVVPILRGNRNPIQAVPGSTKTRSVAPTACSSNGTFKIRSAFAAIPESRAIIIQRAWSALNEIPLCLSIVPVTYSAT
jgi:hypothetical protein